MTDHLVDAHPPPQPGTQRLNLAEALDNLLFIDWIGQCWNGHLSR